MTQELYKDVKVYLCVDSLGGMCDRLCFGDKALIDNANTSIDTWNDGQSEDKHEHVQDVRNALSVLATDNFDVVEVKPNTVHIAETYIVSDIDITTYGNYDVLCHSPKRIWNFIQNEAVIDLNESTDEI